MLVLNIELTHEKGLDDKMILKSELFSKEVIYSDKKITLQMKNGIEVTMHAQYDGNSDEFGPSSIITINGELKNNSVKDPTQKKFTLSGKINESQSVTVSTSTGQNLTLVVTPSLK